MPIPEWDTLASEGFDTTALLRAVDVVDRMRSYLGDGENGEPPDLRTDLLRLHQLAMDVFNQDARRRVAAMFETRLSKSRVLWVLKCSRFLVPHNIKKYNH